MDDRAARPLNPVLAAVYGALVALVVGYALSYLFTRYGLGVVGATESMNAGPAVFARAGLNLYAAQHVTLVGQGEVRGVVDAGVPVEVSALLTVPITVWAAIPAIALLIAGYLSASARTGTSRWRMIVPAVVGGLIYAAVLAVCSRVVQARIESFVVPDIGGVSANPPDIAFHPSAGSALLFAGAFGVVFTCLGALIAARAGTRDSEPGRWWVAGKVAVVVALAVQVLMMAVAGVWLASQPRRADAAPEGRRVVEMMPAIAGIAYAMVHGANLVSSVESHMRPRGAAQRTLYADMSLYSGTKQEQLGRESGREAPLRVAIPVAALTALVMVLAGWLAVRWGSRGGSLPTALRLASVHTLYLAALVAVCRLQLVQGDPLAISTIALRLSVGWWLLFSFLGVLVLSMIGAHLAGSRSWQAR